MATSSRASTVIGPTSFIRGRVSGDGDLAIAGRVEGDVACSGEVVIDTTGLIAANVSGARIVVRGAVKGDLVAHEALVVEAGARVVGDLRAPRVAIAPGGLVRGHVQTGHASSRPRAAAAPSRAAASPSRAVVESAPAPRAVKAAPEPAKVAAKPSRGGAVASARRGPPPPVVPVLRKGTKGVQKKRS